MAKKITYRPVSNAELRAATEAARRWIIQNHPALAAIRPTYARAGKQSEYPGALATAKSRSQFINYLDPSTTYTVGRLGQTGAYRGIADQRAIQTMLHELGHMAGPHTPRNATPFDRSLEEGLATTVSADLTVPYTRSLRYDPRRFEDGTVSGKLDFAPADRRGGYPRESLMVDDLAFAVAARQNPNWAGNGDPTVSPEANYWRQVMLAAGAGQRRGMVRQVRRQQKQEREAPAYARTVARNVGRVASSAGVRTAASGSSNIWERAAAAARVPARPAPRPPARPQNPRTVTSNQGRRTGRRPGDA